MEFYRTGGVRGECLLFIFISEKETRDKSSSNMLSETFSQKNEKGHQYTGIVEYFMNRLYEVGFFCHLQKEEMKGIPFFKPENIKTGTGLGFLERLADKNSLHISSSDLE